MAEMELFKVLDNLLETFDYTYMFSDDHRCWQNGERQRAIVNAFIVEAVEVDLNKTRRLIAKHRSEYGVQFKLGGRR